MGLAERGLRAAALGASPEVSESLHTSISHKQGYVLDCAEGPVAAECLDPSPEVQKNYAFEGHRPEENSIEQIDPATAFPSPASTIRLLQVVLGDW